LASPCPGLLRLFNRPLTSFHYFFVFPYFIILETDRGYLLHERLVLDLFAKYAMLKIKGRREGSEREGSEEAEERFYVSRSLVVDRTKSKMSVMGTERVE